MGYADLHCHTLFSGVDKFLGIPYPESVTPPEKMVDAAVKKNFDVLCVTDHNAIKGAYRAHQYAQNQKLDIDIVIGEEISSSDGEILGLFIQDFIPPGLTAEETIDQIRQQDGLVIAPHPYSYHCPSLGDKIKTLKLDGVEILNGFHRDPYVNKLAERYLDIPVARLGGSDAHSSRMLGTAYTMFEGETPDDLYFSIKNKKTTALGKPANLRDCILWSMEIPYAVIKTLLQPNEKEDLDSENPLNRVTRMKKRNKAIALFGCILYIVSPLPYILGILSEGVTRHRARKKWHETMLNTHL